MTSHTIFQTYLIATVSFLQGQTETTAWIAAASSWLDDSSINYFPFDTPPIIFRHVLGRNIETRLCHHELHCVMCTGV